MYRFWFGLTAALWMFSAFTRSVHAQVDATCLVQAMAHLRLDQPVTVIANDGRTIQARLAAIDFSRRALVLYRIGTAGLSTFTIKAGEITRLEYRKPIRPSLLFGGLGFLAGTAIGAGVEAGIIQPGSPFHWFPFQAARENTYGAWIGGVAGLIVGLFAPNVLVPTGTIHCR